MKFIYFNGFQTPCKGEIMVFGSNLGGIHGAGAAKYAAMHLGARKGIAEGFTGLCYAIPTKDKYIKSLPFSQIRTYVSRFVDTTYIRYDMQFLITAVGTGLAGYRHCDVAPLFRECNSANCRFDERWQLYLEYEQE